MHVCVCVCGKVGRQDVDNIMDTVALVAHVCVCESVCAYVVKLGLVTYLRVCVSVCACVVKLQGRMLMMS